ncbi:MAG: hypothetical protein PVJ80_09880 [Gemmatimonadota bacterium]
MTEVLQQEIRTLRSVFESERDPEGRVFAPLADAYRRAGEVQQAVRLLNEGLARHPQFVPGHVVAAQLYVEQGMVEEAGIAARHALELDGENVNALQSLLKVLEQNGDDEAAEVRDRLVSLDPRYQAAEAAGASATAVAEPPPLPQEESAAEDVLDIAGAPVGFEVQETPGVAPPATEAEADIAPEPEDTVAESPFELEVDASGPELAREASTASDEMSDEPLIDLDSLGSLASEEVESESPDIGMAGDLAPELEAELPTEEPVLDLDDLAPAEVAEDGVDAELEAEPIGDVPGLSGEGYEEPVMDLADLGPSDAEGATVDLADLAPEPEEETVMDLAALAPDEPAAAEEAEEEVIDLADLAPATPEPEDEPVALADLAPEAEEEDEPVALADLAPDEPVMELSDLAPTEEEETVVDLAALAPDDSVADEDEEEAVDLADLAPSAPQPEEEPVALADLAPEPEEEEEPVALADLAPEPEEEPVMELSDLAPTEEEETVMDLAALAPDEPAAADEEAVDLADLAPAEPEQAEEEQAEEEQAEDEVTMVGLMSEAADTGDAGGDEATSSEEVVVDMDALRPIASETEAEEPEEATDEAGEKAPPSSSDDDHEPGEPVYTRTLAELYVKQGAVGQAIEVYRHLASLDPEADDLRRRIDELESGEGLEEEPVLSEEAEEEVEALARELSQSGEEAHDEADSPFNLHGDAEEETPAEEPSGPTIGDYFEGLLGWKPGQRP